MTRRKSYSIKLRGGKIIGEGSYGTVIKPAVACYDNKNSVKGDADNYISKIFTSNLGEKDQEQEAELLDKIRELDPSESFSINRYQKCNISSKIPELSNRKDINVSKEYFPQLILPYGGIELYYVIYDHNTSFTVTKIKNIVLSFMTGFKNLQKKMIIHNDIKTPNMLMGPTNDKLYLIDFGMAISRDSVFKKDNIDTLTYKYSANPPEYQLIGHIYNINLNDIDELIAYLSDSKNYKKLTDVLLLNIKASRWIENVIYKLNPEKYHNQIDIFLKQLVNYLTSNRQKYANMTIEEIMVYTFRPSWDLIDIYALGVVFSQLLIVKSPDQKSIKFNKLYNLFQSMRSINISERPTALGIIQTLRNMSNSNTNSQIVGGNIVNNNVVNTNKLLLEPEPSLLDTSKIPARIRRSQLEFLLKQLNNSS